MTRNDTTWEENNDRHASRRDQKRRPRMPVVGKSVLLLSRIVRAPSRKRRPHSRRRTTRLKAPR
jgi:hypothetical protein